MAHIRATVARVRLFYDPTREPLRRRVYSTLLAVVTLAVGAGVITGTVAATLAALAPLVLMVPATEAARRLVTPVADPVVADTPGRHAEDREATR